MTIRGDVEKTAKREESWGPTRAAKCAADRSFCIVIHVLRLDNGYSRVQPSVLSILLLLLFIFYHAYYRFHETPRCASILFFHPWDGWKLLHIRMNFHFSILRLRIVVNLWFFDFLFLSWNLKEERREERKEEREGIQNYFCNFWGIASGVNIHRRLKERNRLGDIPTISLIFNRLDSWQQLFNVLGRGNGSRGHHLCA